MFEEWDRAGGYTEMDVSEKGGDSWLFDGFFSMFSNMADFRAKITMAWKRISHGDVPRHMASDAIFFSASKSSKVASTVKRNISHGGIICPGVSITSAKERGTMRLSRRVMCQCFPRPVFHLWSTDFDGKAGLGGFLGG